MSPFGKIRVGSAKGTGPRTLPCCAISRSISCAKSPARRACPASASPVLWIPSTCSRYCWESNFNALALGRGQHGDWKYFWSDFPASTPLAVLVEYVHRRHWVEQYHEEAKTDLGWDQYQGWCWDGFHQHAITVMLSYSFLVWLEGREREQRKVSGRPRAAFSPSPGPSSHAPPRGPSSGERIAALCRHSRIDRTGAH